jgi:integrase
MAHVITRIWRSGPRKAKRIAYGYLLTTNGQTVRRFDARWTPEDAQRALEAAERGEPETPASPVDPSATVARLAPPTLHFAEAVARYAKAKARKRTLRRDLQHLAVLTAAFGGATPLTAITAARISAWKADRLAAICSRTGALYSPAAINRPLQALSGLLHLARDEWEVLAAVPRIRLEKEPEGHVRWLEPDEEARLLDACRASSHPHLADIVTIALETGLRKGELLALTWERVDLSRGVIRLEITKGGRRREVPMRQAVYAILAGSRGPRDGRVWPNVFYIDQAFGRALKAAKLEAHFRFHDCRHHFASWFMMRGGSLQALKEILGHRDLKMTLRYAHLSPGHLRQEMAKTERPAGPSLGAKLHTKLHKTDELPSR